MPESGGGGGGGGGDTISPPQIEQWIVQSYDPTNRPLQQHATQCLQQYISLPSTTTTNSNTHAPTLPYPQSMTSIVEIFFTILSTTSNPMIQFYVLSTLHRVPYFPSLSNLQRMQLRHYLLESGRRTSGTEPTYIRNKAAAILSTFLIQDTSMQVMRRLGMGMK